MRCSSEWQAWLQLGEGRLQAVQQHLASTVHQARVLKEQAGELQERQAALHALRQEENGQRLSHSQLLDLLRRQAMFRRQAQVWTLELEQISLQQRQLQQDQVNQQQKLSALRRRHDKHQRYLQQMHRQWQWQCQRREDDELDEQRLKARLWNE
ncbi:hypothetical protein [Pseudomonas alkylphenolica]|uniref:hypothetical protein n=1 Tax=Pseudomonas alkylphenolica TaxID=237609 RepID=UPI0018D781FE|nr:hypothetical protein [Pseudomonas alkylphenolica]MBH3427326.1 hypothetical protein [Pseudomonas alkylphenolica]